jgi:hypothetical protein
MKLARASRDRLILPWPSRFALLDECEEESLRLAELENGGGCDA